MTEKWFDSIFFPLITVILVMELVLVILLGVLITRSVFR